MNRQRTVIYEKRRHALMGERIGMDITNIIWDRCLNIINNNDFDGAKEEFLKVLAMEIPFTVEEYESADVKIWQSVCPRRQWQLSSARQTAFRLLHSLSSSKYLRTRGAMYERIMVPLTDGKRMYRIPCNLKEAYESEAKSVVEGIREERAAPYH